MARHFDQRAIERAGAILKVAERYSGDELDAALKAARRAIEAASEKQAPGQHWPHSDRGDRRRSLDRAQ